jgi:hypothetical protein
LTKKEAPKGDFTSTRGIDGIEGSGSSGGESTPEIKARRRESLAGNSGNVQDEKDQLMKMMSEQYEHQEIMIANENQIRARQDAHTILKPGQCFEKRAKPYLAHYPKKKTLSNK